MIQIILRDTISFTPYIHSGGKLYVVSDAFTLDKQIPLTTQTLAHCTNAESGKSPNPVYPLVLRCGYINIEGLWTLSLIKISSTIYFRFWKIS